MRPRHKRRDARGCLISERRFIHLRHNYCATAPALATQRGRTCAEVSPCVVAVGALRYGGLWAKGRGSEDVCSHLAVIPYRAARGALSALEEYKDALLEQWRAQCDSGRADPTKPPKLPALNECWVFRWRYRYNVSYRTVNLRYKIPRSTFMSRLRVFWTNCIIIRTLFACFNPGEELEFIGFDQKPMWFNAITQEKSLSVAGASKVGVAENVSASRARFTVMTQCISWVEEAAPAIGILFKIGEAACSLGNLRKCLAPKPSTLIQGAPRGSYRLEQVLEFLRWAVKPATAAFKTKCVVLDWFAPHLDPAVDELMHSRSHAVLRIGGGLTSAVQVEDTHAHRPYNNHYRKLEVAAAKRAWDLNPGKLLECSRQAVTSRAEDAWQLVDHAKCSAGWAHDGIKVPLEGGAGLLSSQVLGYWIEIGMDGILDQVAGDVRDAVAAGDIASFWQYPELLQDYDHHEPMHEGMEGAPAYVYDESGAHGPIGDAGEVEGEEEKETEIDAAIAAEAAALDGGGCLELAACGPAVNGQNETEHVDRGLQSADGVPPAGAIVHCGADEAAAQQDLATEGDNLKRVVAALAAAEAELRSVGQRGIADFLGKQMQQTLRKAERRGDAASMLARTALRAATLQRKRKIETARAEECEIKARAGEMDKKVKIATEERLAASHKAKVEQSAAKMKELEAKAAKAKEKEAQVQDKKRLEDLRRTFAGDLAREMQRAVNHKKHGGAFRAALLTHAAKLKGAVHQPWKKTIKVPDFWDPSDKRGLRCMSVKDMFGKWMDGSPVYASEDFAWEMWGHKKPEGLCTKRLESFVEDVMPGYKTMLAPRYPVKDLLKYSAWNADVAFLSASWYYGCLVPKELHPASLRAWPPVDKAACGAASSASSAPGGAIKPHVAKP